MEKKVAALGVTVALSLALTKYRYVNEIFYSLPVLPSPSLEN